jgi:hypothetical protein
MLRVFYSYNNGFKFLKTDSKECEFYESDGISCCDWNGNYCDIDESITELKLFIFFNAEGCTINFIDNRKSFLKECDEYYSTFNVNEYEYIITEEDNIINVELPHSDLGTFKYYDKLNVSKDI